MDATFKKLNFKGHSPILVLHHPESFEENLASVKDETEIITKPEQIQSTGFVLAFVTKKQQIDALIPQIAPKLEGDAVLWMCYPKGSSKNYTCDFNRDTGWQVMGQYELEPVRQVSIDADWSALRFRKVDHIKTMKRKFGALSEKGKEKTKENS